MSETFLTPCKNNIIIIIIYVGDSPERDPVFFKKVKKGLF